MGKTFLKVIVVDTINEKFGDVNNIILPESIEEFARDNLKTTLNKDRSMSVDMFQQWCDVLGLEIEINVK